MYFYLGLTVGTDYLIHYPPSKVGDANPDVAEYCSSASEGDCTNPPLSCIHSKILFFAFRHHIDYVSLGVGGMSEPDWAIILGHLYEGDGIYTRTADGVEDTESDSIAHYEALTANLREELNLDAETYEETHSVINHLEMNDLIEKQTGQSKARLMLQPDGFEVAHDRELEDRHTKTNIALIVLTLGLVMANIVGNHPNQAINEWGGWVILLILGGVIYTTDIFDIRI